MRTANSHRRRWRPYPLALIALLTLGAPGTGRCWSGARGKPSPKADPTTNQPRRGGVPTLTVATYNVNFGLAGDRETLAAIGATGADVVLLQETTPAWETAIRRALSARYPHQRFRHSRRWPAGGLAVLSRYPLEGFATSPSPIGFFDAARVRVRSPLGTIQLLNVHLKPPVSRSGSYIGGYFSTPPERRKELRAHLQLLDARLPTVVAGDFNEARGGGLAVLKRKGWVDALQRHQPRATTWRWPVLSWTLRMTLDHLVYDPTRLCCIGARVQKRGRSDHLPVVARFRRAGGAPTPEPPARESGSQRRR